MEKRICIVGGGLAGLCVGIQLYNRNIPFLIIHDVNSACSSEKAAGLMNPVVVKRLLKTWMADEVLPYNRHFYPQVEALSKAHFYSSVPVFRSFSNELPLKEWQQRLNDGTMDDFMGKDIYAYAPDSVKDDGFGGADILQASRVDCEVFIQAVRNFFSALGSFENRVFDYDSLILLDSGFEYKGQCFSDIVFCEGVNLPNNPWFGKLPLIPSKGELLHLHIEGFPEEKEVLKGIFLAPLIHGGFVCGSTYEWEFENEGPTDAAKQKLLDGCKEITNLPVKVLKHTAGIRPASRDRRPFLGEHPRFNNMYVLNGLGTKGYMLAPYMSHCLVELICEGKNLPKEADIKRLAKKMSL